MGAWGVGNFENDDAGDWMWELEESAGTQLLISTLEAATKDGYLESPTSCSALAAAEIVAALKGRAAPNLPDDVGKWVATNATSVDGNLLRLARDAVLRIKDKSELQELWQETGDFAEWQRLLEDLLMRLNVT